MDTRDKANPTLICTSREENCFKVFTLDGRYLQRIDLPSMFAALFLTDQTYTPVFAGRKMQAVNEMLIQDS